MAKAKQHPQNLYLWQDIGIPNPRGITNSVSTEESYEWLFVLLYGVTGF